MAPDIKDLIVGEKLMENESSTIFRGSYLGQPAIVKSLRSQRCDARGLSRFRFEFELIRECATDAIPRALAYLDYDGRPAQIYEDIGAVSVASLIEKQKELPLPTVLKIAIACTKALEVAHRQQIIHKDVNPRNMVFNPATGRAQLIDFGIATKLRRESQESDDVQQLEGTFGYLSPEQTGRMNRSVDHRSDFFSLGASLYEMTTGINPFAGADAAESVHRALASVPKEAREIRSDLPVVFSAIIHKLLEKEPEKRYASAFGLVADLERVSHDLQKFGHVEPFALGLQDSIGRFEVPEKLYGRSEEVKVLLAAFERAASGANEFVEIAGPSGIGKSSLVNEIKTPLVGHKGHFVSGKFDQFKRNIPYFAIRSAIAALIGSVLKEGDEELSSHAVRFTEALQDLAPVAVDFVPNLADVIGPKPVPEVLDPERAKHRLLLTVGRLLKVFAGAEHPVAIFLDDIQWADSASLDVLSYLAGVDAPKYLMMIVAYRSEEVGPAHPTRAFLNKIEKERSKVTKLEVTPLILPAVIELLQDTLRSDEHEVAPLGEVVLRRTSGNAFFIRTFLAHLYETGIFTFDTASKRWRYDVSQIGQLNVTDNVAQILLNKINALGDRPAKALSFAACIGSVFDLATLSLLLGENATQTAQDLWTAVNEGLIIPRGSDYKLIASTGLKGYDYAKVTFKFAHDRVQRASHDLIAEDTRSATHYQIGRLLIASLPKDGRREQVFTLVDHLNYGLSFSLPDKEKAELAELNVEAGQKAQDSGAYTVAVNYYQNALTLIGEDGWNANYSLISSVYFGLGRSLHAMDRYEEGVKVLAVAEKRLKTPLEKAQALELMGAYYESHTEYLKCIRACLKGMSLLGVQISEHASDLKLLGTVGWFKAFWLKRTIRYLEIDGVQDDPRWKMIFTLATRMGSSAFFFNQNLFVILYLRLFVRAQKEKASLSYPGQTILLGMVSFIVRDKKSALKFRELAHRQLRTSTDRSSLPIFYALDGHWTQAIEGDYKALAKSTEQGYKMGVENGDLAFAGISAFLTVLNAINGGFRLPELEEMVDRFRHFFLVVSPKNHFTGAFLPIAQLVKNLLGKTDGPETFSQGEIKEESIIERTKGTPGHLSMYKTMRGWLYFHREAYVEAARLGASNLVQYNLPGCFSAATNAAITGLSIVRAKRSKKSVFRFPFMDLLILRLLLLELRWWNSLKVVATGLYDLVNAEFLAVKGKMQEALSAYEKAADRLKSSGQYYWVAVTHASLAAYYERSGHVVSAAAHWREAVDRYLQFGAVQAAEEIQAERPNLFPKSQGTTRTADTKSYSGTNRGSVDLDFESIVKASQTLSGQIDLDRLVADMLHIAMENAGATHGTLLMTHEGRLRLKIVGEMNGQTFRGSTSDVGLEEAASLTAISVVRYVARTREEVVLNDVAAASDFGGDAFVRDRGSKSIICLPIVSQNQLSGVMFLENRLVAGAFTAERIETLRILAAQGAISLVNAGYVKDLRASSARISHLKGQLEKILAGTKEMAASRGLEEALSRAISTITSEIVRLNEASIKVLTKRAGDAMLTLWEKDGGVFKAQSSLGSLGDLKDNYLAITRPQETNQGDLALPIFWQGEFAALVIFTKAGPLSSEEEQFVDTVGQSLGLSLKNIEYQSHLEDLVRERTKALNAALAELTAKKAKIEIILNNIDQGILTFDETFAIEPEFSLFTTRILQRAKDEIAGADLHDLVFSHSKQSSDALEQAAHSLSAILGEDKINWTLNSSRLPRELSLEFEGTEKILAVDWKPMPAGDIVEKMMLTMRDITVTRALELKSRKQEAEQNRKLKLIGIMLNIRRSDLQNFIADCSSRLNLAEQAANEAKFDGDLAFRELHTVKGSARTFKFQELAELVHATETALQVRKDFGPSSERSKALSAGLAALQEALAFMKAVHRDVFGAEADKVDEGWSLYTFASEMIGSQAAALAKAGIELKRFDVVDRVLFWDEGMRSQIQAMLVHCLNNALDHGYLLPRERGEAVGAFEVELNAQVDSATVRLSVSDRGAGINLSRIEALAAKIGQKELFLRDPYEILFATGASTAEKLTMTSGRGVGLAAIRGAARDLGGDAKIGPRTGGGTVFEIRLPLTAARTSIDVLRHAS